MIKKLVSLYSKAYAGFPRMAWVLFFVQLVNASGSMVLFYLTLYMTRHLNFNLLQAGRVMSLYGLGQLVGAYLGGWLSDRLGSNKVQFLSLSGCGVFFIGTGQLHTLPALATTVFMLATFSGALFPANSISMARACPPELRTRGYALNRLATNIGFTIGPVVGGFLAMRNYRLLFWVDGLTSLTASIIFWFKFREPGIKKIEASDKSKTPGAHSPWKDIPFLYLMIMVFVMGIIFFQFFSTFSIYLRTVYALLEKQIGWLLTINTLMIIFIEMPLLNAIRPGQNVRVIALGGLLLGAGFALMPWGRGMLYAGITVAIWSLGEILTMPLLTGLVADRSGPKTQGRYMGIFSFAFSLAFIVGPIAGVLVYRSPGPTFLWSACGVLGILLFAGFLFFRRFHASLATQEN